MHILDRYKEQGFSFFNTQSSKKKVITSWKEYQDRYPTDLEIENWKTNRIQNYAIVCGEISDLVVFDVDTRHGGNPTPFQNRGFYEVRTPSGGYHFYTKYNPLFESTKHLQKGILKGVDVQSTGALVFCPPSSFGKDLNYTIAHKGEIKHLPEDLEIQIFDAIDIEKRAEEYTPYTPTKAPEKGRPGDIFNALAQWEDILIPAGWSRVGKNYWRRPGKKEGISASTNWNDYDLFFPFTTSTELEPRKGYTKFSLLAHLKYDGDYTATAKALVMENYKIANSLI